MVQRSFFLVVSATLSVCVRFFSVVLHGFHVVFSVVLGCCSLKKRVLVVFAMFWLG